MQIKDWRSCKSKFLPIGYGYEYSEIIHREEIMLKQTYIFLLCLVFPYFYYNNESYMLPFAVLLSSPVGLAEHIFALFI
jgi:HAE1 family hydrophobic/amphiphilic exporter-1